MSGIKVGVVGLGAIAQAVHLPLLRKRWDLFELAGIADLSASVREQVGRQFGVPPQRQHASLEGLLGQGDLDALLLLSSGSHGGPALTALRAGVPVFCEKPLALSRAEADALLQAELQAGRPMLLLAYMKERDPAVLEAGAALDQLGELRWIEVEVLHPSNESQLQFANLLPRPDDVDPELLNRLRAADDSVVDQVLGRGATPRLRSVYANLVLGSLIHDISLLRHLVGTLDDIDDARLWEIRPGEQSLEVGGWRGRGRVRINWHFLPEYPAYRETLRIHGARGSLELEFSVPYVLHAPTRLTVRTGGSERIRQTETRDITEAFEEELVEFAAMVRDGTAPRTGIAEGREDIRTAQRIIGAVARSRGEPLGGEASGA